MDFKNVLIFGYARSGKAVEAFLLSKNIDYKIYDKKVKADKGKFVPLTKKVIKGFDTIVLSPGVSIYNKKIDYAKSIGINVISELEFGYLICPYPIIAVTGTNGKTTTTLLLQSMLHNAGLSAVALGNVGQPLSCVNDYQGLDYVVCEVSSFQLEAVCKFKPHIAVMLNIEPDHLDRHKTFDNYKSSKLSMLDNMEDEVVIVDKSIDLNSRLHDAIIVGIDVAIKNNKVCCFDEELCDISKLPQYVNHNNILACVAVCKSIGVANNKIIDSLYNFKNLPHRLNIVDTIGGVKFVNDSKSTNIASTINAVSTIESDIVLILGGVDKCSDFDKLCMSLTKNIKHIVTYGKAGKKIANACKCKFGVSCGTNFKQAFYEAIKYCKNNDVLLLSPACASFDEFESYIHRGEVFENLVASYGVVYNLREKI